MADYQRDARLAALAKAPALHAYRVASLIPANAGALEQAIASDSRFRLLDGGAVIDFVPFARYSLEYRPAIAHALERYIDIVMGETK